MDEVMDLVDLTEIMFSIVSTPRDSLRDVRFCFQGHLGISLGLVLGFRVKVSYLFCPRGASVGRLAAATHMCKQAGRGTPLDSA